MIEREVKTTADLITAINILLALRVRYVDYLFRMRMNNLSNQFVYIWVRTGDTKASITNTLRASAWLRFIPKPLRVKCYSLSEQLTKELIPDDAPNT